MCAVNDESGSVQLDSPLSILAVNTILPQRFIFACGRRLTVACAPQNKSPSQHTHCTSAPACKSNCCYCYQPSLRSILQIACVASYTCVTIANKHSDAWCALDWCVERSSFDVELHLIGFRDAKCSSKHDQQGSHCVNLSIIGLDLKICVHGKPKK